MAKISLRIPDIRACSEKDLAFAINLLATELRKKQDAELLCKNCGHEIEKGIYGAWLHVNKQIPPKFTNRMITNIITCVCGCHDAEPLSEKKRVNLYLNKLAVKNAKLAGVNISRLGNAAIKAAIEEREREKLSKEYWEGRKI